MRAHRVLFAVLFTSALGCASVTTVDPPGPNETSCDERCEALWAFEYGDAPPNRGQAIGSDAEGNVYFAAEGSGDVDLGGGVIDDHFLVAKLDPAGALVWAHGYPKGLRDVAGFAVSPRGDVAFAGTCRNVVDLGGGALVPKFNDHEETCVAVLDASGAHVWSARFGTNEQSAYIDPTALAVTPAGDVILALAFTGTVDLDGVTQIGPEANLNYETLLARFDPQGHLVWARHLQNGDVGGAASLPIVSTLAVTASGDVAMGGMFYGSIVIDEGLLSSKGEGDAFVALLSGATGDPRWVNVVGGSGADGFLGLASTADGAVIAAGWYSGALDVGGQTLADNGAEASCLIAFEPSGEVRFARSLVDLLPGQCLHTVSVRPDGDLVVTAPSASYEQGFDVLRLDASANDLVRHRVFLAPVPATQPNELVANGIALDPLGNALITGSLRGSIDFGTGVLTAGPSDMPWAEAIFVAKIDP